VNFEAKKIMSLMERGLLILELINRWPELGLTQVKYAEQDNFRIKFRPRERMIRIILFR
jgi:hypothetical protein